MNDAHGKGMAIQFNTLMDKGAFAQQPDGTFAVDMTKLKLAVRDLDHDLLTIEAQGDYAGAKKMLDEMGVIRPILNKAFVRLEGIPTDVELDFVTADELAPEKPQPPAKPAGKKRSLRDVGASVPLVQERKASARYPRREPGDWGRGPRTKARAVTSL